MVEWLELRVSAEHADKVFASDEGKVLGAGLVRRVRMRTSDPRIELVRGWQSKLNEQGKSLFFGWSYVRRYRTAETSRASAFLLREFATFEPEGESCGTVYDDGEACVCGVPRRQVGPLRLRASAIPRGVHLARTIADEIVVSSELLRALESRGIKDVWTGPVYHGSTELRDWRQLLTSGGDLRIGSDTVVGNDPFDPDLEGQYRCPGGCVRGLNLISELTLAGAGLDGRHIAFTKARVGVRRGVLVPRPLIIISPLFRTTLVAGFDRRCRLEVVYSEGQRPVA
jgi:hypothetical protein